MNTLCRKIYAWTGTGARAGARTWTGTWTGTGARTWTGTGVKNEKQYTIMSKQLIKIIKN